MTECAIAGGCLWSAVVSLPVVAQWQRGLLESQLPSAWRYHRVLEQVIMPGRIAFGWMRLFSQWMVGAKTEPRILRFHGELIAEKYYSWSTEGLRFAGLRDGVVYFGPVLLTVLVLGCVLVIASQCGLRELCHSADVMDVLSSSVRMTWWLLFGNLGLCTMLHWVIVYLLLCLSLHITMPISVLFRSWQAVVLATLGIVLLLISPMVYRTVALLANIVTLWLSLLLLNMIVVAAAWALNLLKM